MQKVKAERDAAAEVYNNASLELKTKRDQLHAEQDVMGKFYSQHSFACAPSRTSWGEYLSVHVFTVFVCSVGIV